MSTNYSPPPRISSKVRAYGKARLDIARRVAAGEDWNQLWKPPLNPFPFDWGKHWRQCTEYKVDDLATEVGFFTDLLGFPVVAMTPEYAMFTGPEEEFTFAVLAASEDDESTPPDAIRLQFMVADIFETTDELERRGVVIEGHPEPISEGSPLFISSFRTPHGIPIELWCEVEEIEEVEIAETEVEEAEPAVHTPPTTPSPEARSTTSAEPPFRGKVVTPDATDISTSDDIEDSSSKYEVTYEDVEDNFEPYEDEDENPWRRSSQPRRDTR
jgi:catechol 2,3-dioxygenase-like lactoylglutathione lyase family enzyme